MIVIVAADGIGIAVDFQLQIGIGQHDSGYSRQTLSRLRLQRVLIEGEQNIGHADDEAAGRVARLQNLIQLCQQALPHFFLLANRFLALLLRLVGGLLRRGGCGLRLRLLRRGLLLLGESVGFRALGVGAAACVFIGLSLSLRGLLLRLDRGNLSCRLRLFVGAAIGFDLRFSLAPQRQHAGRLPPFALLRGRRCQSA